MNKLILEGGINYRGVYYHKIKDNYLGDCAYYIIKDSMDNTLEPDKFYTLAANCIPSLNYCTFRLKIKGDSSVIDILDKLSEEVIPSFIGKSRAEIDNALNSVPYSYIRRKEVQKYILKHIEKKVDKDLNNMDLNEQENYLDHLEVFVEAINENFDQINKVENKKHNLLKKIDNKIEHDHKPSVVSSNPVEKTK